MQTIFKAKNTRSARADSAENARARPQRAGMLENASIRVKLGLIMAALALGMLAIALSAERGLKTMQYHTNNLYEFMLIPIMAISRADTSFSDMQRRLEQLNTADTSTLGFVQRDKLIDDLKQLNRSAGDVIKKYETEWLTTTSPDFTATLKHLGQSELQAVEVNVLESLKSNYANSSEALGNYLKAIEGNSTDIAAFIIATGSLSAARQELQNLIAINDQFAKLSADDAGAAYVTSRWFGRITLLTSLVLALILGFVISNLIIRRMHHLTKAVDDLGQGNFETTATVRGRDEIGVLGRQFNLAASQLLRQAETKGDQERQQRLALQKNVSEFLNVAMEIAEGDLTRRGNVTEDVLGNVVDAINLMVEEIGLLLKDVNQTASVVDQNALAMGQMSAQIAQSAEGQAHLAEQAHARTVEVTQSIRAMAQGAAQTTAVAQKTLQSAQQGQEAVQETLSGMEGIRRETQNLADGVRNLAQRSLEVQSIVKTIANFASQTNLLALGAALEAAGAGEAGKRFATVADQVRRLADESTRATQQVAGIMKRFESEIEALIERAEGSTREVEQGYALASKAGGRLQEIAQLARQSAALVQGISNVTQQQVANVEQVSRAAQMIAQTAAQTGSDSSKGRQAAEELQQRSVQLISSLSRFRLPA
jgi:twitching motility protein PilJ